MIDLALAKANQLFHAGQLPRAERACRQVLDIDASHVEAWFLLGLIGVRRGAAEIARDAFTQVVTRTPHNPEAHNNLGTCLARERKFQEAADCFRRAVEIRPDYPEALNNLGNALRDAGKPQEAIAHYERALELRPSYVDGLNNLGMALARIGKLPDAETCYRRALDLRSDHAEAHNNLGICYARRGALEQGVTEFETALRLKPGYADAFHNLGTALRDQGRVGESAAAFTQALKLRPDFHQAMHGLGAIHLGQGRIDEAVACFEQACQIAPDSFDAHQGLGDAMRDKGEHGAAIAAYRKALRLRPKSSETLHALGRELAANRQFSEALWHFNKALEFQPEYAEAHRSRALTLLLMGEFSPGWNEYEWRWRCAGNKRPSLTGRQWEGEPLEGKRILLYCEQRNRDTLQFIRYAKIVKEQGATVLVRCPAALQSLLRSCPWIDHLYADTDPDPGCDLHLPLLSLPRVLGSTLTSLPKEVPYLTADPTLTERWRKELSYLQAFKVGIHWQGLLRFRGDHKRFIPLAHFAPLAAVPGVRLISLQRGIGSEQVAQVSFSVTDTGNGLEPAAGAFAEAAAILKNLDLFITADTSLAHLAGALGIPVWLMLPYAPDWRWLLHREDSPWYPTMRLFRQTEQDNWEEVCERIAAALKDRLSTPQEEAPAAQPTTADALNAQGARLAERGRLDEAVIAFRQALEINSEMSEVHNNLGNALRNQGRLPEASRHLQQAIALRPDFAEAHNNLGICLARQRKSQEAIAALRKAVELKPDYAQAFNNLGVALLEARELDQSREALERALAIDPEFTNARVNLGNVYAEKKDFERAVEVYREVIDRVPDAADAHNNLGNALRELGKSEEALESLKQAVTLRPQYADAFNNLGITYSRLTKYEDAQKAFEDAIRLRPDHAAAHNNLGIALAHQNLHDKAIASYQQALRIKSDYSEAHNNLAIVLTQTGRHAEADAAYRRALELKSNYAEAHSNWGIALTEMGKTDEALEHYGRALELRAEYPDAHMNRALTWLLRGDFERGWEEYEWRWQCKEFNPRPFRQPRWQGEPLEGRRILLHSEQGLGDTFQFIRYTKLVKERGGVVVIRCPKPLTQILRRCPWIDQLCIEGAELPDFDVHLPLLSLPWIFRTTLADVPADVPYLFADPQLVEHWHREFSYIRAFRIGINWQGNPRYRGDHRRSIPLAHFAPLAAIPGVRLICLQRGLGTEQIEQVRFSVTQLGSQVDTVSGAFMDTAAILKNLDLVITSDTSLVHLAGALGVPVWMAVPYSPDWRWLLQREDSPWYPTMRLFRQKTLNNWEEVFDSIASAVVLAMRRGVSAIPADTFDQTVDHLAGLRVRARQASEREGFRGLDEELQATWEACRAAWGAQERLHDLYRELEDIHAELRAMEEKLAGLTADAPEEEQLLSWARTMHGYQRRRTALKDQLRELATAAT
jgi:tetratricopeptide (TPR) repeat protein